MQFPNRLLVVFLAPEERDRVQLGRGLFRVRHFVAFLFCVSLSPSIQTLLFCSSSSWLTTRSLLGVHLLPCRMLRSLFTSMFTSLCEHLESTGWSNDFSRSLVREPRASAVPVVFTRPYETHGNSKLLQYTTVCYPFNKPALYLVSPLKDSYVPIRILTGKRTILPPPSRRSRTGIYVRHSQRNQVPCPVEEDVFSCFGDSEVSLLSVGRMQVYLQRTIDTYMAPTVNSLYKLIMLPGLLAFRHPLARKRCQARNTHPAVRLLYALVTRRGPEDFEARSRRSHSFHPLKSVRCCASRRDHPESTTLSHSDSSSASPGPPGAEENSENGWDAVQRTLSIIVNWGGFDSRCWGRCAYFRTG